MTGSTASSAARPTSGIRTLIEDNHFVEQPYSPEDGYHFSKDIADKAISFIRDTKQSRPDKPWYMWYCPGANHAPHHAPKEYIDKYKGQFDDGYEAYREWVLARMIEKGVLPPNTELTELNPMTPGTFVDGDSVRPGRRCPRTRRRCSAEWRRCTPRIRSTPTSRSGVLIDYLEDSGQLDNTLIFYCADNGASGEGSPNGSVNENRFFNGYPDDIEVQPGHDRQTRLARDLQPLPDGLGRRVQHAVPHVQALLPVRGRHG